MKRYFVGAVTLVCIATTVVTAREQVYGQAVTPAGRADAGAQVFATYCAGCHGADARGGERGPNIVNSRNVIALTDENLASLLQRGVPGTGMPAFASLGDQSISDLVAHIRMLQGKGNAVATVGNVEAGKALFFGPAKCSECHTIKGQGGYIASDLTEYANGISSDVVQRAIIAPDAVLASSSNVVELRTFNGEHVTGVARADDNFNITVQSADGRWRTFDKSRLADLKYTGHSLHPRDYEQRLTSGELSDLVSYLVSSAASAPPKPARRRNQ